MPDDQPLTSVVVDEYDPELLRLQSLVDQSIAASGASDATLEALSRYFERRLRLEYGQVSEEMLADDVATAWASLFPQIADVTVEMAARLLENKSAPAFDEARAMFHTKQAADPVDLVLGGFTHTRDDLLIRGAGIDALFRRTYRNQASVAGSLGAGWDHSLNLEIRMVGETRLRRTTGELFEETFVRHQNYPQAAFAYWVPPDGASGVVIPAPSGGTFIYLLPDGTRHFFENVPGIADAHRVRLVVDRFGNFLKFGYAGGRLSRVEINSPKRWLHFTYDDQDRIAAIVDVWGRRWHYRYDDYGDLVEAHSPVSAAHPRGSCFRYEYSSASHTGPLAHNLLRIVDAEGRTLVENEYGTSRGLMNFNRVIRQIVGGGEHLFEYEQIIEEFERPYSDTDKPAYQINYVGPQGRRVHYLLNRFGNVLMEEEPVISARGRRWTARRARFNGDGRLIAELSAEGQLRQYHYGRDEYVRLRGVVDADVKTDPRLTLADCLGLGDLLATVRRHGPFDSASPVNAAGMWGAIFPEIGNTAPEDVIAKMTYEQTFHQPETISDPRHTTSALPTSLEPVDYVATLTTFEYAGPALLLARIRHPDVTPPSGITQSQISESFGPYDPRGRLMGHQDPNGLVTTYKLYGAAFGTKEGFVREVVVDPGGLQIRTGFELNDRGAVLGIRHPKSWGSNGTFVTRSALDEFDNTVGVESSPPFRYKSRFRFDRNGEVTSDEHELLDENLAVQLASPIIHTRRLNAAGFAIREEVLGSGGVERLAWLSSYNGNGQPTSTVGPTGVRTVIRYDGRGRLSVIRRAFGKPEGTRERRQWDDADRLTRLVSPGGRQVQYEYDPLGRICQAELASGSLLRFDYDKLDNLMVQRTFERMDDGTFGLVGRDEYEYDEWGRLTREHRNDFAGPLPVLDPTDEYLPSPGPGRRVTSSYTYDAVDNLIAKEDEIGQVTRTKYDLASRLVELEDALGNRVSLSYDTHNNLIRRDEVDVKLGHVGEGVRERVFSTEFVYDELDRLVAVRDGMGNVSAYDYDSRNLITATTNPLGGIHRRTYDLHDRVVMEVDELTDNGLPDGQAIAPRTRQMTYDGESNMTLLVDALGTPFTQDYDALNRPVVSRRSSYETAYGYDGDGILTSITEPNGLRRRFFNDRSGRPQRVEIDTGNLNPGESVEGETVEIYEYDANGLPRIERNDFAEIRTTRDSLMRAVEESFEFLNPSSTSGTRYIIRRTFDDAGNLLKVTYPSGCEVEYARDELGRLSSLQLVTLGASHPGDGAAALPLELLAVSYWGSRRDGATYLGNSSSRYQYDAAARLIQIVHDGPSGVALLQQQRLLDGNGNVRTCLEDADFGGVTQHYAYDSVGALTHVAERSVAQPVDLKPFSPPAVALRPIPNLQTDLDAIWRPATPAGAPTYRYDPAGNRREERRAGQQPIVTVVDALSQVSTLSGTPLKFDDLGRLIEDERWSYRYDGRGLLTSVRALDTGIPALELLHDSRGRCVAELTPGSSRSLIHDDLTRLEEYEGGLAVAQYAHQGFPDSICHLSSNGVEHSLRKDSLGSIRLITTASGSVAGRSRYDPFGRVVQESGYLGPLRFAGRPLYDQVGLVDLRARAYSPDTGRFLQPDPVGPSAGSNPYSYALGNPLRFIDPFGAEPGVIERTAKRAAGGAVGALKNFFGFVRLGVYDSWAQTFSDAAEERIEGAQDWLVGGMSAVDEGAFSDWVFDGVQNRLKAIETAEDRGDHFGAGAVFGDSAMNMYTVGRGGVSLARSGVSISRSFAANGWSAIRGVGFGIRRWATTYDGTGIFPAFSSRSGILRGSENANYSTHAASRSVARFTYQAEVEIARGVHESMGLVRRWRAAPEGQKPMWYGKAVERIVDTKLMRSGDPILTSELITRRAFGRNAKGNNLFPDYRIQKGNQSVIDITSPGQAGKALKYPAGNVIEPYTGTVRIPFDPIQSFPMPTQRGAADQ